MHIFCKLLKALSALYLSWGGHAIAIESLRGWLVFQIRTQLLGGNMKRLEMIFGWIAVLLLSGSVGCGGQFQTEDLFSDMNSESSLDERAVQGLSFAANRGYVNLPFDLSNGGLGQSITTEEDGGLATYLFFVPVTGSYVLNVLV